MIQGILFDFDGTIVDSEHSRFKATNKVLEEYDLEIIQEDWNGRYIHLGSAQIFSELKQINNLDFDVNKLYEKAHKIRKEIEEEEGVPLVKGFREFHTELVKRNIKIIICSGGTTEHMKYILKKHNLEFMNGFGRDEYKNRKPAPDAFLLGLNKIGLLKNEVIVFEDSMTGIQSALDIGIKSFLINTKISKNEFPEIKRFNDFTEVNIDEILKN